MTSTQQFIVAIIEALISSGLITLIINMIFQIQKSRLEKVKAQLGQYHDIIEPLVIVAEKLFKVGNGEAKLEYVYERAAKAIHLPEENLKIMIKAIKEQVEKDFGAAWDKLGTTDSVIPSEIPPPPIVETPITPPII